MSSLAETYQAYQEAQARVGEARAAFFVALHAARETQTLEQIGQQLGLTRQRVHGILKTAVETHAEAHNPQEETPVNTEPKPVCTCRYPDKVLRNGSGHAPSCPVHAWTLARVRESQARVRQQNPKDA